jgi:polyhydroxybutyrate depolymerase
MRRKIQSFAGLLVVGFAILFFVQAQAWAASGEDKGTGGDKATADSGSKSVGIGKTSKGCGATPTLQSGRLSIDVSGTKREYILKIPSEYKSTKPYMLIFTWHWMGGKASDIATGGTVGLGNYYGLETLSGGNAIFVSPEGINNGWPNTNGRDIAFLKAMLDKLDSEFCIDKEKIFSTGFSYGGMMSYAIGCEMGDVFRGIAPMSGALYSGCGKGTHPVAMWGAHGLSDPVVPISNGRTALKEILNRNHCGTQTTPVDPSPCVSYQGCDSGYPVTWCEFEGGHGPQKWAPQQLWNFFNSLKEK